MKQAKIAILKNNLSRYLAHVRGGGSVLVFRDGLEQAHRTLDGSDERRGVGLFGRFGGGRRVALDGG